MSTRYQPGRLMAYLPPQVNNSHHYKQRRSMPITQTAPITPNAPILARSAPLWRRFAALGYDSLILMALSMGYGAIITSVQVVSGTKAQDYQPMLQNPLYFVGWMLVLVSFYLYSWCRSGQTIGMRAWRIRVITTDTKITGLSFKQALLRCVYGSIGLMLAGAGYWYYWINKERNTWHDKMTATQVIVCST